MLICPSQRDPTSLVKMERLSVNLSSIEDLVESFRTLIKGEEHVHGTDISLNHRFDPCKECDCGLERSPILDRVHVVEKPCEGCDCRLSAKPPHKSMSGDTRENGEIAVCDACEECDDTCDIPECQGCKSKRDSIQSKASSRKKCKVPKFTMCQVRRCSRDGVYWIAAHKRVYDISKMIAQNIHPGGAECLLRKAGTDCTRDFDFHSSGSRKKIWPTLQVGRIIKCKGDGCKRKANNSHPRRVSSNAKS